MSVVVLTFFAFVIIYVLSFDSGSGSDSGSDSGFDSGSGSGSGSDSGSGSCDYNFVYKWLNSRQVSKLSNDFLCALSDFRTYTRLDSKVLYLIYSRFYSFYPKDVLKFIYYVFCNRSNDLSGLGYRWQKFPKAVRRKFRYFEIFCSNRVYNRIYISDDSRMVFCIINFYFPSKPPFKRFCWRCLT